MVESLEKLDFLKMVGKWVNVGVIISKFKLDRNLEETWLIQNLDGMWEKVMSQKSSKNLD